MPYPNVRQLLAQGLEVLGVRVPAAVGQGHAADAGLDQPAGGQELLDALVAIARRRLLVRQVESLADGSRRRPCRKRGVGEGVQPLHGAAGIDVAADVVEADEQILAIVQRATVHAVARRRFCRPGPLRRERPMGDAEEAGLGAGRPCRAD